jgi:hypothetical protein
VSLEDEQIPSHTTDVHSEHHTGESLDSDDPRRRPADPAGTQPKVDPESLKPSVHHGQLALTTGPSPSAGTELAAVGAADSPVPAVPTHQPLTVHASRFQFLLGVLIALGVAAVGLTVLLLSRPGPAPSVPWSSWQPSAGGGDPAAQIADHVAPLYKLSDGHQLVAVTGGPQAVGGQPVVLALRSSGSEPAPLPSNGVFYQLCGTGPGCSIPGKASVERGLLVRREALELALYTFRYIGEASQVVVTFPPPPPSKSVSKAAVAPTTSSTLANAAAQTPSHVLLFRPDELSGELSKPLYDSLSASVPGVHTMNASADAPLVNRLTLNAIYDSTLSQQESTLVMLLQSPSLGG